jgi:hypothetical protein
MFDELVKVQNSPERHTGESRYPEISVGCKTMDPGFLAGVTTSYEVVNVL